MFIKFSRIYKDISFFFRRIKWYFVRGKQGWSAYDTWNLDYYLAKVIRDSITYMKKYQHGIPATSNTGVVEIDYDEKRWKEILDTIIFAFDCKVKMGECELEAYNEKFKEFVTKNHSKVKYVFMTKEEDEKMKLGLQYFIEYFDCLWN